MANPKHATWNPGKGQFQKKGNLSPLSEGAAKQFAKNVKKTVNG